MTKTVKQVVDEYIAKQNETVKVYEHVKITQMNGCNSVETKQYNNVSNLQTSLFPDIELYGMNLYKINFVTGGKKVQVIGKIIEIYENIEE